MPSRKSKLGILQYTSMETKKCACFEITSNEVKLLIGYCLGEKPVVLYSTKRALPAGLIDNGVIVDEEGLINAITPLCHFKDDSMKLDVNLSEVCLVLAPFGLKIYQSQKTTVPSNPEKKVSKLDIAILIQLGKNENIPAGTEVVDIIPSRFTLSDKSVYKNPPLGMQSDFIAADLFIYTLPKAASSDYSALANNCNLRIKKSAVAPYCETLLYAQDETLPKTYLLLDIGERYTAFTLVGNTSPIRSQFLYQGGANLTDFLAAKFGISFEEAENLKRIFGYSTRKSSFLPSIGKGTKEGSLLEEEFTQKEFNDAIEEFFKDYFGKMNGVLSALESESASDLTQIEVVLTGGGSKLEGLTHFFASYWPSHNIHFPSQSYLGVDAREFAACLGMVIAASHYSGSMEDNQRGVASVTRTNEKKEKRGERRNSAQEDTL